jgi:hypothetical protein
LLHFLALFVATFGGVTPMVLTTFEIFGHRDVAGSEIATTNFVEFFFFSTHSGE